MNEFILKKFDAPPEDCIRWNLVNVHGFKNYRQKN